MFLISPLSVSLSDDFFDKCGHMVRGKKIKNLNRGEDANEIRDEAILFRNITI